MKTCPACGASYSARIDFCFIDGEVLSSGDVAGHTSLAPEVRAATPTPRRRSLIERQETPEPDPDPAWMEPATEALTELQVDPVDAPSPLAFQPPPSQEPPPVHEPVVFGSPPPLPPRHATPDHSRPAPPNSDPDIAPLPTLFSTPAPATPRNEPDDAPPETSDKAPVMWVALIVIGLVAAAAIAAMAFAFSFGPLQTPLPADSPIAMAPAAAQVEPELAPQPISDTAPVEPAPQEDPADTATVAAPPVVAAPVTVEPPVVAVPKTDPPKTDPPKVEPKTPPPEVISGKVALETVPPGATVLIDGKKRGQTPLTLDVPYGAYRLEFELSGHAPERRSLDVRSASAKITVDLKKKAANQSVSVRGLWTDGATLLVDGREIGPLPLTTDLSPGSHRFAVRRPDGTSYEVTREVVAQDGPQTVDLSQN